MRTAFAVEASVGYAETLDGPAGDKMFGYDLRRVAGLDIAVPDGLRINHDHGAVLALIQAAGFVDADLAAETGGFGALLQFGVQLAGSVACAGWTWSAFRARVAADKDMALKCGQVSKRSVRCFSASLILQQDEYANAAYLTVHF